MRYLCKVIYRDRVKPTTYLEGATVADLKTVIERLLQELSANDNMRAIYIGKSESEIESVGQNTR